MQLTKNLVCLFFVSIAQNSLHASLIDKLINPTATLIALASPLLTAKSLYAWHEYSQKRESFEKKIPGLKQHLNELAKQAKQKEKRLGPDWQVIVNTPGVYENVLGRDSFECNLLKNYLFKEKLFLSASLLCAFTGIVSWKFLSWI